MVHNSKECSSQLLPIRDAIETLGGKWKLPIIAALRLRDCRFKDLQRQLGITPKMLSFELKDLEQNQLVKRTEVNGSASNVVYSLAPYADSLKDVIMALHEWGTQHRQHLMGVKAVNAAPDEAGCTNLLNSKA